jgi:hypothetical protein
MAKRVSSFTSKWRKAFRKAIPTNWLTFGPAVAVVAAAVAKLSAQIIGLTGHLASALPSAAALIPVLGGLATATFALIRSWGQSKVMEQAINRLDNAIRRSAVPAVDLLGERVKQHTPMISAHFANVGVSLVGRVQQLNAAFEERGLGGKLQGLLDSMALAAEGLSGTFANLVESIITIGDAAGEAGTRFTSWLEDVTTRFRNFLNLKSETGELQQFFNEAADAMALWGGIFANTLSAIAGMLAAAAGPGERFAQSLLELTERWKAWAWNPESHGKIASFLERLGSLDVSRIFEIAASITAIGIALKTMMGLSSMVQGLTALIALGPVAGVLTAIALGLGAMAGAFTLAWTSSEAFRESAQRLINFLVETFGPIIAAFAEGFMEGFRAGMEGVAAAIDHLIVAAQGFMVALEDLLEPMGGATGAAETLGHALGGGVAAAIATVINGIASFLEFLTMLMEFAAATASALTSAWNTIKSVWNTVVGAIGAGVGSIAAFFGRVIAGAFAVGQGFLNLASMIAGAIGTALGWIGGLIGRINAIPTRPQSVYTFLSGGSLGAIGAVISALSAIPRYISTSHVTYHSNVGQSGGGSFRGGGVKGARGGGNRGGLHWVGEDGPELMRIPTGSTVYPTGQSERMDRSGGGGEVHVTVEFVGVGDAGRALLSLIRPAVKVRGGKPSVLGIT